MRQRTAPAGHVHPHGRAQRSVAALTVPTAREAAAPVLAAELASPASDGAEMLARLVAAEEGVRGQLAAELHDTVAQSLALARALLAESDTKVPLEQLREHVEDAEEQLRAVLARARPPALREGDLADALAALSVDVRARYAVEVAVRWPDSEVRLSLASATTVYRFCSEALLNVVKHADVEVASLWLELEDAAIVVGVRDEGPGFDPREVHSANGRRVGLALLAERARMSGGSLSILSQPSYGTTLRLRLPLPAAGPVRQETEVALGHWCG